MRFERFFYLLGLLGLCLTCERGEQAFRGCSGGNLLDGECGRRCTQRPRAGTADC